MCFNLMDSQENNAITRGKGLFDNLDHSTSIGHQRDHFVASKQDQERWLILQRHHSNCADTRTRQPSIILLIVSGVTTALHY
jgi:hypothetical protein